MNTLFYSGLSFRLGSCRNRFESPVSRRSYLCQRWEENRRRTAAKTSCRGGCPSPRCTRALPLRASIRPCLRRRRARRADLCVERRGCIKRVSTIPRANRTSRRLERDPGKPTVLLDEQEHGLVWREHEPVHDSPRTNDKQIPTLAFTRRSLRSMSRTTGPCPCRSRPRCRR